MTEALTPRVTISFDCDDDEMVFKLQSFVRELRASDTHALIMAVGDWTADAVITGVSKVSLSIQRPREESNDTATG